MRVVDEYGNEYEATYPKRAKGLVKKGRARFLDEHTICLACPANEISEELQMADTKKTTVQETAAQESKQSVPMDKKTIKELFDLQEKIEQEKASRESTQSAPMDGITVKDLLNYINMVRADNATVMDALQILSDMPNGDNADPYSPGNTLGMEKAKAITDVVRCRETTNQKILAMYEKMYDDLIGRPDPNEFGVRMAAKESVAKTLIEGGIDPENIPDIFHAFS